MAGHQRVRIFNQAFIDGPAEVVWDYLTDWGCTRIRPAPGGGKDSGLGITSITLTAGERDVPRTRVIEFAAMDTLRETLLYQSDEARHYYYNIEGAGPFGIRNYLAHGEVDRLGEALTQVTLTARFDLVAGSDAARAKAFIDAAHINGVFGGLRAFFGK